MKEIVHPEQQAVPGWVFAAVTMAVALVSGFVIGDDLLILAAALGGLVTLVLFGVVPLSLPVKLIFLLVLVAFLQRVLGYFKLEGLRGLNAGNLLLLVTFIYWFLSGLRRGSIYRPSPIDLWVVIAAIIIPLLSIFYTVAFQDLPGYSLNSELLWYKQWVTPFLYFFLIYQCLDNKPDIRKVLLLILGLVTLAIFYGLPEALRFTNWRDSRSLGILGQPNSYAALLAVTSPFFFLVFFRLRLRPIVRVLAFVVLSCMTLSLLTTFSRGGYMGFGVGLLGALYVSHRGLGRAISVRPIILVATLCLVPFAVSPQLIESVQTRFSTDTYKRAKRKSYTQFGVADSFSGGRLQIWKAAIEMAQDKPLFGVGFHAFELELPKYHPQGLTNYPHNQYLGALAEGGLVWLAALLILFWKVLLLLYHNWRVTLQQQDAMGQVICGGAMISFCIMLCMCMGNDFFGPGPKVTIFWVCMAGAIKYGTLSRREAASASV